jgi:hypothetical protein
VVVQLTARATRFAPGQSTYEIFVGYAFLGLLAKIIAVAGIEPNPLADHGEEQRGF